MRRSCKIMLTFSAKPKFFRSAAIALLGGAAWFSAATLVTAQTQDQDQNSSQQNRPTDATIQYIVAAALQQDSSLHGQHVSAAVDKGIVTLNGTVQTEAQSHQAETDASNIAGVSGILNHLEVRNADNTASQNGLAA